MKGVFVVRSAADGTRQFNSEQRGKVTVLACSDGAQTIEVRASGGVVFPDDIEFGSRLLVLGELRSYDRQQTLDAQVILSANGWKTADDVVKVLAELQRLPADGKGKQ